MRSWGISASLAGAFAFALAACAEPPQVRAEEVCDSACSCAAPIAADRATCTSTCVAQLGAVAIPDSCLDCLDEPLCTSRETCFQACLPVVQGTP